MALLYKAISSLIDIIKILILIRIISSFLNIRGGEIIKKFIHDMTEPVLAPARALIAKTGFNTGMFDFSPIVAIIILNIVQNLAMRILV